MSLSMFMTGYMEAAKTLLRTMKRAVTTAASSAPTTGNGALENECKIRVLTIDETEVDTIRATTLWCPLFDRRYVIVCWDVVETMSYVKTGANTGRVKKKYDVFFCLVVLYFYGGHPRPSMRCRVASP